MKRIISLFLGMLICVSLIACENIGDIKNTKTDNSSIYGDNSTTIIDTTSIDRYTSGETYVYKLQTASNVDESYIYKNITLKAGDIDIPVYNCKTNFSHSWNPEAPNRMNNAVAIINLEGCVRLTATASFKVEPKFTIRPLNKNVSYSFDDEYTVSFDIKESGQYTIEFSNDRTLHLFVNEYDQYEEYRNDKNVMYFSPGIHNSKNDNRIPSNNRIYLSSNTTVFIDQGAIVEAAFVANNASNIKIVGYGIVSGATFDRNATTGTVTVPYDFNYCSGIKFYGISTLDPAGWCYNIYFCKNVELDNIKIISSRSNGDGVSLQSCEDVTCKNSFVRSWDDSLVVKNYPKWSNRNEEGTTRNIYFDNCVLWTDLAQSMEIGFETVGQVMDNINFTNITVLHNFHKPPISIHNGNNANITNVHYDNIVIEDASMGKGDGSNTLIEITAEYSSTWSTNHKTTGLGSVNGILIENVTVIKSNTPKISIRGSHDYRSGYESDHFVSNVTFRNIVISGLSLTKDYENLEMTYTDNIKFE